MKSCKHKWILSSENSNEVLTEIIIVQVCEKCGRLMITEYDTYPRKKFKSWIQKTVPE